MLRNRIIHQNELMYVGPAFESGETYSPPITTNLDKLQSISYSFGYQKTDVAVVGNSSPVDRPISSSPVVSLNLEYLLSSFHNEKHLGMKVTPQGLSSSFALLSGFADETNRENDKKNLYIATSEEGVDMIGGGTGNISGVLCFHDCQVSSYDANFTVNEIAKASVSMEGINASYFNSGSGLSVKVIDRQTADQADSINVDIPMTSLANLSGVFIPGNISVSYFNSDGSSLVGTGFEPVTNDKAQDFGISFNINRRSIDLPDHKITYDKLLTTPIIGSASTTIIDHGNQSGSLADVLDTNKDYKIVVEMSNSQRSLIITLNEARIDSINYNHALGDKKAISMSLSYPIDPFDKNKSLNFSGAYL